MARLAKFSTADINIGEPKVFENLPAGRIQPFSSFHIITREYISPRLFKMMKLGLFMLHVRCQRATFSHLVS